MFCLFESSLGHLRNKSFFVLETTAANSPGNFGNEIVLRGPIQLYRGKPARYFPVVGEEGDLTLADVGS